MSKDIQLPEQYRRTISIGLSAVEEMLEDMTGCLKPKGSEERPLPPSSSASASKIIAEIQQIRKELQQIRDILHLHPEPPEPSSIIFSRCAKIWEVLSDLKTKKLKGYGQTPAGLVEVLDPKLDSVLAGNDRILNALKETAQNRKDSLAK